MKINLKKTTKKYILSKFQVAVFSFLSSLPSAQKILMSGKVFALAVKIPVSPQELSSDGLLERTPVVFGDILNCRSHSQTIVQSTLMLRRISFVDNNVAL